MCESSSWFSPLDVLVSEARSFRMTPYFRLLSQSEQMPAMTRKEMNDLIYGSNLTLYSVKRIRRCLAEAEQGHKRPL